jgi:tetraacyldisaccharide 4'-kinase
MNNTSPIISFFEKIYFNPNPLDWVIILILSSLSLIYGSIMFLRRIFTLKKDYYIPIISIGNLTVGGSGKTPFVIALASRYKEVTIISRGYGRESRGLIEVSQKGKILCSVFESGDEPMLMAKELPNASVIVSEDRDKAIEFAKDRGAKIIFLDDGFNRVSIKKFEILLFPKKIKNYFPFPAGPFREFYFSKLFANLSLIEDIDFYRSVKIKNPTEKMILVTAISNPQRLEPFLPKDKIVEKIYFKDHSYFDKNFLQEKLLSLKATSLLVTQKDEVKLKDFKLPLSIMELELQIENQIFKKIDKYIGSI